MLNCSASTMHVGTSNDTHLGGATSGVEANQQAYPLWAHQLAGSLLTLVGIVGFAANMLVLFTFYIAKHLRTPTNIFIIGLNICDVCMLVFGFPLALSSSLYGSWFAGECFCHLEAFSVYLFGLSSVYILTAISIDRYIVITKPSVGITKRTARIAVVSCFGLGLFWAVCPALGWSSFGLEASGVFCGLRWSDKSVNSLSYLCCIAIFCFLGPMFVMTGCYCKIYLMMRTTSKNMAWNIESRVGRRQVLMEKHMLKTCIFTCGAFWLCWLPYAFVSFWQIWGDAGDLPIWLMVVPAFTAKSQVVWNPLIYVSSNKQFRVAFSQHVPYCGIISKFMFTDEMPPVDPYTVADRAENVDATTGRAAQNLMVSIGSSSAALPHNSPSSTREVTVVIHTTAHMATFSTISENSPQDSTSVKPMPDSIDCTSANHKPDSSESSEPAQTKHVHPVQDLSEG